MELNYAEVGGRVRDLRRARHLTQEALAEQCNISSPSWATSKIGRAHV